VKLISYPCQEASTGGVLSEREDALSQLGFGLSTERMDLAPQLRMFL
jgi:hypothetical protein